MKHLNAIRENAERTARRLGLEIEQVSGFSDGLYRVEYKEPKKADRRIGFATEDGKQ